MRASSPYVPGEQPAAGAAVIKLNTNENPYPPSPRVLEALAAALDERLRLYPDPEASALRKRAAEVYGVPADHILVGNGSDELLALVLRATVDPGEVVAFPVPTYSLYATLVAVHGARAYAVPWTGDWGLPPALAAPGARVTFVCNPNAPSGTMVPIAALETFAREARGLVVIDEAYVDFAPDHALRLVGRCPNVVVLRTFSKSFSLAGMRLGLCFGHPDLLAGLRTVKDSYNVNRLSQIAGLAALEDLAWMEANARRIRADRAVLAQGLERLGYAVLPSAANFVLARRPGIDQGPIQRALAAQGVLVRHFATPELFDALRITVGTTAEIETLLEALRAVGPRGDAADRQGESR